MLVDCHVSTETPKASWSDVLVGGAAHGTLAKMGMHVCTAVGLSVG